MAIPVTSFHNERAAVAKALEDQPSHVVEPWSYLNSTPAVD